ncbi:unannotated protein [freshwater metagenome]|uniref:Unannotated protein n=1 Tax=freshwater metagenome TaxID=449393 RepID=A0A6J7H8D8_9ZZZZ
MTSWVSRSSTTNVSSMSTSREGTATNRGRCSSTTSISASSMMTPIGVSEMKSISPTGATPRSLRATSSSACKLRPEWSYVKTAFSPCFHRASCAVTIHLPSSRRKESQAMSSGENPVGATTKATESAKDTAVPVRRSSVLSAWVTMNSRSANGGPA